MEISTIAYLPCALLAYAFWWHKPFDAPHPIQVQIHHQPGSSPSPPVSSSEDPLAAKEATPTKYSINLVPENERHYYQTYPSYKLNRRIVLPPPILKHDEQYFDLLPKYYFAGFGGMLALASILFGAVHCAAWNYPFESYTELLLWRISCIALCTGTLTSWLCSGLLIRNEKIHLDPWLENYWYCYVFRRIGALATACYIFARLYLIFEVIFALRSSPASCYETVDWTEMKPHL